MHVIKEKLRDFDFTYCEYNSEVNSSFLICRIEKSETVPLELMVSFVKPVELMKFFDSDSVVSDSDRLHSMRNI